MKKYFAIAFVLLVILLLVLRKQTEPTSFRNSKPAEIVIDEKPATAVQPVALSAATPPTSPASAASPVGALVAAGLPTKEKIEELRKQAKNALASSYTAQRSAQAEWDRFTSDLVYTGWEPASADLNFKMGFLAAFDVPPLDGGKEKPERFSTDAFVNQETYESNQKIRYTPAAERIRLSDYARYCEHDCLASQTGFEMLLAMPLDDKGHVDVWLINDKKEIKQVVDGMKP